MKTSGTIDESLASEPFSGPPGFFGTFERGTIAKLCPGPWRHWLTQAASSPPRSARFLQEHIWAQAAGPEPGLVFHGSFAMSRSIPGRSVLPS